MTTFVSAGNTRAANWSSSITNASFQAICARYKAMLDGCGLVQTSDTGQLNPATATFPGSNYGIAGYWIYRFNDTLQATAPIFIKVEPGRGDALNEPYIRISVGSATNGAGALTGVSTQTIACGGDKVNDTQNPVTTDFAYHREGVTWFCFETLPATGTVRPPTHFFLIERTTDPDTGELDGLGVNILANYTVTSRSNGMMRIVTLDFVNGMTHAGGGANQTSYNFMLKPSGIKQLPNGDYIAWPYFSYFRKKILRLWSAFAIDSDAVGVGANIFQSTTFGVTAWRLCFGAGGQAQPGGSIPGHSSAENLSIVLPWDAP
jgi:hypothetical protein